MRLQNRGFGVGLFVIVFLCAVSVAAAQTIVSPTSWSVPAVGGTQSIVVATARPDEAWTASPAPAVTTAAGSTAGTPSFADGTGTDARFAYPNHLAADAAGNVYVADWGNNRIRKVTPAGEVTTFAGSGAAGGADGTGTAASFNGPRGIAIDASGTLYVAESWGHRIRKITPEAVVTTAAGNGTAGYVDAQGTNARFWYPSGIAVDGDGTLYVTEEHNCTVRRITPAGEVTTLAGDGTAGYVDATGTEARFNVPFGVAVDAAGNVYVADSFNHRIRKVTAAGVVTTVAGSGTPGSANGTGTAAQFNEPWGLAIDTAGNVYVAERVNHLVRRIGPDGTVTTLAGSSAGYADGTGTVAQFTQPVGVALTTSGSVLIVSEINGGNRIRRVTLGADWITVSPAGGMGSGSVTLTAEGTSSPFPRTASVMIAGQPVVATQDGAAAAIGVLPAVLDFGAMLAGAGPVDRTLTVTNAGNVVLTGWQWSFGGLGNPVEGTCGSSAANPGGLYSLTPGQSCTFVLRFTPLAAGSAGGALSVGMTSSPGDPFDVAWEGTWTATVAPPTIALNGLTQTYDGTPRAVTATPTPAGLTVTVTYTGAAGTAYGPSTTPPTAAGTYGVSATTDFGGIQDATLTIEKASPIINWPPPSPITAGTPLSTAQLNATTSAPPVGFSGVATAPIGTNGPAVLTVDAAGALYIGEYDGGRVLKVVPSGDVEVLATTSGVYGIAVDVAGTVYVSEIWNHRILKILPNGTVGTLAGSISRGSADGIGAAAQFYYPCGLALDGAGRLYVADRDNHRIRRIDVATGAVTTVAGSVQGDQDGTGASARFNTPWDVAFDGSGTLYVADTGNMKIRKLSAAGAVTTVAGSVEGYADGTGAAAKFAAPWGIAVDAAGMIYVADGGNGNGDFFGIGDGNNRVRVVSPTGDVATVAGSGAFGDADGLPTAATFNVPRDVGVGPDGTVFVADQHNNKVRVVTVGSPGGFAYDPPAGTVLPEGTHTLSVTFTPQDEANWLPATASVELQVQARQLQASIGVTPAVLDFGNLIVGSSSVDQPITVTNTGEVTLSGWQWSFGGLGNPVGGTCGSAAANPDGLYSLTPGQSCTFVLRFTPLAAGGAGGALSVGMTSSPGDPFDVAWEGTWTATVAPPTIVLGGLAQTYDGTPRAVTATPTPAGLTVTVTYTGAAGTTYGPSTTPPTAAGTYSVSATTDLGGIQEAALTIEKATPIINWPPPSPIYAGTPLSASQLNATTSSPTFSAMGVRTAAVATTGPVALTFDAAGTLYVGEYDGGRVLKVLPSGEVETLATPGSVYGIAVDAAGTVYVSDIWNHRILKILPNGTVGTLAGSGAKGSADGVGTAAQFYYPCGLAFDAAGMLYVADRDNHRIRKIDPATGAVTTVAGSVQGDVDGSGTASRFNTPCDVDLDASGNLYVADTGNMKIRKVSPAGAVTTLAGSVEGYADGPGADAKFAAPWGIAVDAAGSIYVADGGNGNGDFFWIGNGNNRVRLVSPSGDVSTVAGSGASGSTDGSLSEATFHVPRDVAVGPDGTVFVADQQNNKVRVVTTGALGSFLYNPPSGTVLPVGVHALSATFVPADAVNWTAAGTTVDLEVQPAPPSAAMSVSPAVLDFGETLAGSGPVDRTLTITNSGDVTLSGWYWTLNADPVGGTCGSAAANPGGLYSLTSGQSCTFVLRFTPERLGQHGGALYVGMRSPSAPAGEPDVTWNGSWTASVAPAPTTGAISGTVTDAGTGAPLTGVTVYVYDAADTRRFTVSTDTAGMYTFAGVPPGTYYLMSSNTYGYLHQLYKSLPCISGACVRTAGTGVAVTAGATTAGIDFALIMGGRVSGTVTDASTGAPLAGVTLSFYDANNIYESTATTDASGVYTRSSLATGLHYVKTTNSLGYLDELYNDMPCAGGSCTPLTGTGIPVTAGTTTTGIDFALVVGGRISGTVTDANTGAPLAGASITVYNSRGSSVGQSVTTDASGAYTRSGLGAGMYYVRTRNTLGYVDEMWNNSVCLSCSISSGTPVSVTTGATTGNIDFGLLPGARLTGRVTDAVTGAALSSVSVFTYQSNGQQAGTNVLSDSSGYYTSYAVVPGTYYVKTSNNLGYVDEVYDNLPCSGCGATTGTGVTVTGTESLANIDFALAAGGTITGAITDSATGAPLPNVTVRVYNASGNSVGNSATTDAAGAYSKSGLASGTYYLKISNNLGYIDEVHSDLPCLGNQCPSVTTGAAVSVTAGTTTSGIDANLTMGGAISGTVTDAATGAPIPNLWVYTYDSSGAYAGSVTTNAAGAYTKMGLSAGTYYLRTSNDLGYIDELYGDLPCLDHRCPAVTTGAAVSVTAGSTTGGIGFALVAGGRVTGTVTDANTGAPLAGISVRIYDPSGSSVGSLVTTDASGVYTKSHIAPGVYYVRTENTLGYVDEMWDNTVCLNCSISSGAPVTVMTGVTTGNIDFGLSRGARFTGRVTDAATGAPLANVEVCLFKSNSRHAGTSVLTDSSGYYASYAVAPGTYYLKTSNNMGYLDEVYDNLPCNGCRVAVGTSLAVAGTETVAGIDFALASGGTISGTVTDAATGNPLPGVLVYFYSAANNSDWSSVTTSATGDYSRSGLASGTYFLRTSNSLGYVDEVHDNWPCLGNRCPSVTTAAAVSVTAGATTSGIDFALATGGAISGTVTDAATGAALANISVYTYDSSGAFVGRTKTDTAGAYIASGLSTGTYYLRTSNELGYIDEVHRDLPCVGNRCPSVTTGVAVSVTAGSTKGGTDFALSSGAVMSGTVTDANTGAPPGTRTVHSYDAGGTAAGSRTTDGFGGYSKASPPARTYPLVASNSQGFIGDLYLDIPCPQLNFVMTSGSGVTVAAGAAGAGINVGLSYPAGGDDIPPELEFLSWAPVVIDTSPDANVIVVTARTTDDLPGNAPAVSSSAPSKGRFVSPSGQPFVDVPLAALTPPTYKPEACPFCQQGIPVTKPGSRA